MPKPASEPPSKYQRVASEHPDLVGAYERLGATAHDGGPLDPPTRELVKLAFTISAGLESAAHAHTRLAVERGATPEDVRHVALLATTTLGFPTMMRSRSWIDDVLAED